MATVLDVSTVIASALAEVGINGRLDVRMDGSRSTSWVGLPTGEDFEVVVSVAALGLEDQARADAARYASAR